MALVEDIAEAFGARAHHPRNYLVLMSNDTSVLTFSTKDFKETFQVD